MLHAVAWVSAAAARVTLARARDGTTGKTDGGWAVPPSADRGLRPRGRDAGRGPRPHRLSVRARVDGRGDPGPCRAPPARPAALCPPLARLRFLQLSAALLR